MSGRSLKLHRSVWLAAILLSPQVVLAQECYTWTDKTPPPGPQTYPKMVYDSARQVAVLFGDAGDTWEWDGSSWTLKSTVGPGPRWTHSMVYDSARGVTVLYGGYGSGHPDYLSDTWEWDGSVWTLRAITGPPPRWASAMAYDSRRGVTVLHGGRREYHDILNDTWEWDGTNWLLRSIFGPTRAFSEMAFDDARGVTVLFGGREIMSSIEREVWEWDGTNWTLVAADSGPWAANDQMIYDSQRQVMVLFYIQYQIGWFIAWEWDGATWTSREVPGPHTRYNAALAYDSARGVTMLLGGERRADLWEWDGTNWALLWGGAPSNPALAFDWQRGITLGVSACCMVPETWQYVDNAWTMLSTIGPPLRNDPALAYDENRGVTVLFGGSEYVGDDWVNYADTWEWDGANWTQRANEGPPPRGGHRMVYDSARGVVVMFGGVVKVEGQYYQALGDTWEWDGSVWTQRATTGPSPRWAYTLAYDRWRGVTVLFGGGRDSGIGILEIGETWEWDGTAWTQRNVFGPRPRFDASMTYDDVGGVSILVGGRYRGPTDGSVALHDTWEWDGTRWLRRLADGSPTGTAVFDSVRGVTVLFGQGETWEYANPPFDCDCDGDRDLRDIAAFQLCFSPGFPAPAECARFNQASDEGIDLADWAGMGGKLTGPMPPP